MKKSNRFFRVPALLAVAILTLFSTSSHSQVPIYYGPLMYAMPFDTTTPPIYVGQPPAITTAYLWFDEAMRLNTYSQVMLYINRMTWDDTAKFIASNLYQIQDDDPLAFDNWSGHWVKPTDTYKCEPGRAQGAFESEIKNLLGFRTYNLLTTAIIADVMVSDTVCTKDPTASLAKDMVLVNSSILDEIKGKHIPSCYGYMKTRKKGAMPQTSPASPIWTYSVPADTGSCLKFAYSPEWPANWLDDVVSINLIDTSGGWWVKPGKEY